MSNSFNSLNDLTDATEFDTNINDAINFQGGTAYAADIAAREVFRREGRIKHISKIIKYHFKNVDQYTASTDNCHLSVYVGDLDQSDIDDLETILISKGYSCSEVGNGRMMICSPLGNSGHTGSTGGTGIHE